MTKAAMAERAIKRATGPYEDWLLDALTIWPDAILVDDDNHVWDKDRFKATYTNAKSPAGDYLGGYAHDTIGGTSVDVGAGTSWLSVEVKDDS